MTRLDGVCPIVATPFTPDGEVDFDSFRSLLSWLADVGVHAATLFGVYGEFYKLDDDERRRMVEVAADTLDGDLPLVVNVTDESAEVAARRARFAAEAGADALMVLPPSFMDPSVADQVRHVERVGAAVDLPLVIQYRPGTTGPIDTATLRSLNESVETVRYYKVESDLPGRDITRILDGAPDRIDALEGFAGFHLIDAYDRGAVGVMPGSAIPEVYLAIHEAYAAGDRERAAAIHDDLVAMLSHLRQTAPMLLHYEKTILERRGLVETNYCRAPAFDSDAGYDRRFEEHYDRISAYLD